MTLLIESNPRIISKIMLQQKQCQLVEISNAQLYAEEDKAEVWKANTIFPFYSIDTC